ncbi:MAG: DsbA family protein [Chloroflexi bacterium]|nr:DsbA family protein [Chloroflexota bacterium]
MPSTLVTVWFDYACPHSYIALVRLEELASTIDIRIDRRPYLTRSESLDDWDSGRAHPLSGSDYAEGAGSGRRQPLYKPGESLGTEPASNRSASTLSVHAATAFAKERGLDGQFFRAASKEYWEQGVDLGSLYTLRRLSGSVGLDWADLWPNLESRRYHDLVLGQHEEAKGAGVARTPAFRIDGALHSGGMGFEELSAAIQKAV